ncbi:MAG: glutamate-cysteine ligase family protein [Acidimicrobiales bacterium]|nr:glutamate-cysteine ligase family protein [Acidimicrobiales bacterium]
MSDPRLALTRRDVVQQLRAVDAAPSSGPFRVGLEQEWHTYCVTNLDRHVHPDEVLAVAGEAVSLPFGSTVTVEPGGQVELATPPLDPWWTGVEALRVDGGVLREALARAGIATVASGIDLFRDPVRTLRQPRYDAMEAYFDRTGGAGRRMMAGSASIQVNIDHGPDVATMDRRWQLAHHIGPALAAAFACSPDREHRGTRLGIWEAIDRTRAGPALASGSLQDDWPAYVLDAHLMLLHDDRGRCRPMDVALRFGDWVEEGIAGRRPTFDDLTYHCTTLFPPVRPRGWLELRWLDALPAGLAEVAIAAVVAVLVDDHATECAAHACRPVSDAWADAAVHGPRHPGLAQAASATLRAAAEALDRVPQTQRLAELVDDALQRWPARGRCPADDLEDRLRRGAGVADLADPPGEAVEWS